MTYSDYRGCRFGLGITAFTDHIVIFSVSPRRCPRIDLEVMRYDLVVQRVA